MKFMTQRRRQAWDKHVQLTTSFEDRYMMIWQHPAGAPILRVLEGDYREMSASKANRYARKRNVIYKDQILAYNQTEIAFASSAPQRGWAEKGGVAFGFGMSLPGPNGSVTQHLKLEQSPGLQLTGVCPEGQKESLFCVIFYTLHS